MVQKYCLIEGESIIEGPKSLPRSWHNISGLNMLTPIELRPLGWLPYSDTKPSFDADLQYLTSEKVISATAVVETYTVNNYTEEQLATRLETERTTLLTNLYSNVKQFISYQENGWPRYDNDLKLNVMNASMTAIAAGGDKPANCVLVETWIYTVQGAFFVLKAALIAAETLAALREVDVTYNWFEERYGRAGTIAADPGISTDDLFA